MDKYDIDAALDMEEYREGFTPVKNGNSGWNGDEAELLTLNVKCIADSQNKAEFQQQCYRDTPLREIIKSLESVIKISQMQEPLYFKARSEEGKAMKFVPLWSGGKENHDQTVSELGFFENGYDTLVINDNAGNG